MPQHTHPSQKKKKKGRAPAHQNTFSYTHNPKSSKTATILAMPIQHVCRRCHEKLEWRKQYRKYKPRSVPGSCNHCQRKTVRAAYHTICEPCSRTSNKSKVMLEDWNKAREEHQQCNDITDSPEQEDSPVDEEPQLTGKREYTRVCAMCVKEPALPDKEQGEGPALPSRKLKLRERRTLERQQAKATQREKTTTEAESQEEDEGAELSNGVENSSEASEDEMSDEDPFLAAVGGADKILTGDSYQQMLLSRET